MKELRLLQYRSVSAVALCLFCLFLDNAIVQANDCAENNANVTSCLQGVADLQKSHDLTNYREESQLNAVCLKVDEAEKCLIRHNCEEDKSVTLEREWQGVKDSFNYICGTGKEEFLEESNCWGSTEAGQQIQRCSGPYMAGLEAAKTEEAVCSTINDYIACMKMAVTANCNEKAARIKTLFAIKFLKPVAKQGNCQLTEDDGDLDEDGVKDSDSSNKLMNQSSAPPTGLTPRLYFIAVFNAVFLPFLLGAIMK